MVNVSKKPYGEQGGRDMKILIVLTSHDRLGDTGRKTGFWLEELAAPYYVFREAGVEITLASPKGGQPPLDPKSNEADFQTDDTRRFEKDASCGRVRATEPPHQAPAHRDGARPVYARPCENDPARWGLPR